MKLRKCSGGVHLFDRTSGWNILFDEVEVAPEDRSQAPRYVSVALTNACDLRCSYCYAPKYSSTLAVEQVLKWAIELDEAGCLGVGFGGGEATTHPRFAELCVNVTRHTGLAVTFTTHGHRLTPALIDRLAGSVHFVRLSVDGVGKTYERLRGRPFASVRQAAHLLRSIAPIGINVVVNADTVGELDQIAEFAAEVGATELLLLPEQPTHATPGISSNDRETLSTWIRAATSEVRLAVSRSGIEDSLPIAEPIEREHPFDAHLHVDASATLRPHAYSDAGVKIHGSILDAVHTLRERT